MKACPSERLFAAAAIVARLSLTMLHGLKPYLSSDAGPSLLAEVPEKLRRVKLNIAVFKKPC